VWAFAEPSLNSDRIASIPIDTPVTIVSSVGQWLLVEWQPLDEVQQGWVFNRWVDFIGTPPPGLPVTPES
jgi:hypothetical protein